MTPDKQKALEAAIKQCRDFAEVLDEEGMDRDGLHIAIYRVCEAAALSEPEWVEKVRENISDRMKAASDRLTTTQQNSWEAGYEQGIEEACRHHLELLSLLPTNKQEDKA